MKKDLHDIDKIFKDALDDHLEAVPQGVWETINNDLDKKQASHFKEKYYRVKRMALVLLLLIFSGIASLLYFGGSGKKNTGITQKQVPATRESSDPGFDSSGKMPASEKNIVKVETAQTEETGKIKKTTLPANEIIKAGNQEQSKEQHTDDKRENRIATNINKIKPASHQLAGQITDKDIAGAGSRRQSNHTSQRRLPLTETNKMKKDLSSGKEIVNNDYLAESNRQNTADSRENLQSGKRKIPVPIAAYLYQPPLLLYPFEAETPDPFIAVNSAAFLNNPIQTQNQQKPAPGSKIKGSHKPVFSLMAFGAPNHSFTRYENDTRLSGPGRNKNVAEKEERQSASFSAGLLVNYGVTKSFIIQSGVVFSSAKTSISPKIIYARPDNNGRTRYEFNCSSGYSYITPKTGTTPAVGDSVRVMRSSSTISYIGIPLSLNYVWQRGKFLLKPGVGLSVNFLTSGKSATTLGMTTGNQKENTSITGLKTAYVDGSIGLGAEFMINRKISIGVRPLLRMALSSINKDTPVRTYLNFMSLETGLKINL